MSPAPETNSSPRSLAEKFRTLPADERKQRILQLTDEEAEVLLHDWEFWARPNQCAPPEFQSGDKTNWLVMAGRGFGKTRVGAEQVRRWVKDFPIVNLVGPTVADLRDVMVRGQGAGASIMEICRRDERPDYETSKRRLTWPNGAVSLLFSAEDPESLRGPQHMKIWGDEIAAWKYPTEVMDQLEFTIRLGSQPQAVYTTTPKPTKLIRALASDPETIVTHGTTYDNRSNLAPKFFQKLITKHENTRLGRQELMAELLEDNPGALWHLKAIDDDRVRTCPVLRRIVIGVDPATTSEDNSDEWGIVGAGVGPAPSGQEWPPNFYVFDDRSKIFTPNEAAQEVVGAYQAHKADRIVAETNNGGDLIEAILRTVQLEFAYKGVHASRGKLTRAEPIAALYEQHRVHHVGALGTLEDEMCDYTPLTTKSPNRMDALVWALWELSDPEGEESVVTFEEHVQISPDLDEFDDGFRIL